MLNKHIIRHSIIILFILPIYIIISLFLFQYYMENYINNTINTPNANNNIENTNNKDETMVNNNKNSDILYNEIINSIQQNEEIAVIYYNLITGEQVKINENKDFVAASTYKVSLNILIDEMLNEGYLLDSELFTYVEERDYEEGTGSIQYTVTDGTQYPLNILRRFSIEQSDNIASRIMFNNIFGGLASMKESLSELIDGVKKYEDNTTNANNEYLVLKYLYENRDKPFFKDTIEMLKNTIYHDRLDRNIENSIVAHKIGSYGSYVHDEGIVFTEQPYIIVVLTNKITNADDVISMISDICYKYNTKK